MAGVHPFEEQQLMLAIRQVLKEQDFLLPLIPEGILLLDPIHDGTQIIGPAAPLVGDHRFYGSAGETDLHAGAGVDPDRSLRVGKIDPAHILQRLMRGGDKNILGHENTFPF